MKKTIGAGLGLFFMISGQQYVLAGEEPLPPNSAYTLGEVVVIAEAMPRSERAGTVYRVTERDIQASGASTLDQALELVPGLNIREGAEGTPRIDVRGFRTRHVHLFLNGIPIRNTDDGQFDPTLIPADIISEIKVLSGGSSVLYGAGGNGAVIDIITKSGAPGVHGRIEGKIGTSELYETNASLYGASGKVSFYGNVGTQSRDAFPLSNDFTATTAEDGNDRENSDRKRTNFFGNMSYALTDENSVGLTLSHVTGENGKPPVTNYDALDNFSKKEKYERIDDLDSTMVQAAFAHDGSGPVDYRGWVYFSQTDTEENGYDSEDYNSQVKKGAFYQDSEVRLAGVHAQAGYTFADSAKATLGMTAEEESWEADGFEVNKSNQPADFASDQNLNTYSATMEYQRPLTDRWQIVLGYGHHVQDRDEASHNDFTYMIGTSFDLTGTTRLKANHARKIRFPSLKQLYDISAGNEDLNTEITLHYEIGVEQQLTPTTLLNMTGFVINATDFIEKDVDTYQNYQDLRFYGIETELALQPIEDLKLRCGLTWMETEDRSNNNTREDLQYRPKWKATLDGQYDFDFGLNISGSVIYVGEQYFYDNDDIEKKQLNDFTLVNFKLTQKIPSTTFEVYAGVNNIFDEDYEESYGLPQPGCTLYTGLVYRF
ncbi:MAG: TonB-dependent receptor [Desulfobulbus sp.]|nr:TonB-dependent receptor [Desulfobulbus sp.]